MNPHSQHDRHAAVTAFVDDVIRPMLVEVASHPVVRPGVI